MEEKIIKKTPAIPNAFPYHDDRFFFTGEVNEINVKYGASGFIGMDNAQKLIDSFYSFFDFVYEDIKNQEIKNDFSMFREMLLSFYVGEIIERYIDLKEVVKNDEDCEEILNSWVNRWSKSTLYLAKIINLTKYSDFVKYKKCVDKEVNSYRAEKEEIISKYDALNNEQNVANRKIIVLRKEKRKLMDGQNRPSGSELQEVADRTRKKNGSLNFSKIGNELGVSHHTAKNYCKELNIT
jgi:hypothetical protein